MVPTPLVMVMKRSVMGWMASVSVALLSDRSGSVTEEGAVTVAVFDRVQVAVGARVAVTVYVRVPQTGRPALSLMLPEPAPALPLAPPLPTLVQLTISSVAGRLSTTVAPVTGFGPWLVTTRV